jgi:hypothetical protein
MFSRLIVAAPAKDRFDIAAWGKAITPGGRDNLFVGSNSDGCGRHLKSRFPGVRPAGFAADQAFRKPCVVR